VINFKQFVEEKQKTLKAKSSIKRYGKDDYVETGDAVDPADRTVLAQRLKQHLATHGKDDRKLRGRSARERGALRVSTGTQERSYRRRYGG